MGILVILYQIMHPARKFKIGDLTGKVAIVTGGNAGIGFYASKRLVEHGAHVIIACRNVKKGEEGAESIKKEYGQNAKVQVLPLDLTNFSTIPKFVKSFNQLGLPLHILINNAGVMATPYNKIENNQFEEQFGVNHLGHFLLTNLLLDKLKASAPARVIHVSSHAHYYGSFNWDDINFDKGYGRFIAYGQSKLANVTFSNELADRLKGTGVTSNSLHPGAIASDLYRNLGPVGQAVIKSTMRTPFDGSDTIVYLAGSEEVEGVTGKFFMDCQQAEPNPLALDPSNKKRLWELSAQLTRSYKVQ
eukprot:TRINITY_DN180_c0_g1_i1.p1 TRINITY_DN180_c0_g1~~TRINITY_DN180_c0_g1_i1.p1  ORF type:complete len:338 (-),score=80.23 TRINITY_DN180_c0_g1_i1:56-964(-)